MSFVVAHKRTDVQRESIASLLTSYPSDSDLSEKFHTSQYSSACDIKRCVATKKNSGNCLLSGKVFLKTGAQC